MFPDCVPSSYNEENNVSSGQDQQMRIKDTAVVQSRNALLNRCRSLVVKNRELEKSARVGDLISFTVVRVPTIRSRQLSHFGWKTRKAGIRNCELEAVVCFSWTPGTSSGQTDSWCSLNDSSLEPWHLSIISTLKAMSKRRSNNDSSLLPDDSTVSDVEDQFQDNYQEDLNAEQLPEQNKDEPIHDSPSRREQRKETSRQSPNGPKTTSSNRNKAGMKRTLMSASFNDQQNSILRRKTRKNTSSNPVRSDQSLPGHPSIYVGDTCTLLSCSDNSGRCSANRVLCVLVNRFWRGPTTDSNDMVLWFVETSDDVFELHSYSTIIETPSLLTCNSEHEESAQTIYEPDYQDHDYTDCGTISETGEKFYIYRVLLYADDFNPRSALFPRGSVGGFYMIPLNLPMHKRRGLSATRTISLTPPGVSTNEVFDYIINDLVDAAVNGISSTDPFGNRCRIFVDVVGFVADYPASSDILDVMKLGALAPCTHCTFRRRKLKTESRYAFTVDVHSSNSSFTRGLHRTKLLRKQEFSKEFAEYLGHNPGGFDDMFRDGKWPLLKLGLKLNKTCKYTGRSTGKPILNCSFEPYLQNAVAPDHCLTGLGKGLIQTTFEKLPDDQTRRKLDKFLCSAIRELGLCSQASIFNIRTKTMHSMSMSYVYCALSIMPFALECLNVENGVPTLKLLNIFKSLISLTFWWPAKETDGEDSYNYVHGHNKQKYYADMRKLAREYLQELNSFCKNYPECIKNVDKPNVHRMMELYTHTVIVFGHALFISEMLLEAAHQPLKSSLSRNNSSKSHITAVYHVLLTDWFRRLLELIRLAKSTGEKDKRLALRNIATLFFGKEVHKLYDIAENSKDSNDSLHTETLKLIDDMNDHVLKTLEGAVSTLVEQWYGQSTKTATACNGRWTGVVRGDKHDERSFENSAIIKQRETKDFGTSILRQMFNLSTKDIKLYAKAIYKKSPRDKIYKQHTLKRGDVIECFINLDISGHGLVHPDENGRGESKCFVLHSIVGTCSEKLWGVCSELERIDSSSLYKLRSSSKTSLQLISLSSSVRRVFSTNNRLRNELTHSNTTINNLLSGGSSFLLRRRDGYPPRQA